MIPFIDLKMQQDRIRDKVEQRFRDVLDHGMYINGPEVKELENALVEFTGAKHAIAVSNGTDAILAALMAIGDDFEKKEEREVIVPDFSFFATAEMPALLGWKIVFADVDRRTYNLDPKSFESLITEKTKAVIPVSLYGQCADFEVINEIAKANDIVVIEDAAQSFGASLKGKKSCNLSTIATTSFFPAKPLGAYGEGGAIFTSDDELAQKLIKIRCHGENGRYNHELLGLNARLNSVQSGVLVEKLKIFPDELEKRNLVASRYSERLSSYTQVPYIAPDNISAWAQYTIQVDNRDSFQSKMKDLGVPTSVHYPRVMSENPVFKDLASTADVARSVSSRVISLPMHPYLDTQTQDKIIEAVKKSL